MIDWVNFFRITTMHRKGYRLTLPYKSAVEHPGQNSLTRVLFMVPLPTGHPNGRTAIADEWLKETTQ